MKLKCPFGLGLTLSLAAAGSSLERGSSLPSAPLSHARHERPAEQQQRDGAARNPHPAPFPGRACSRFSSTVTHLHGREGLQKKTRCKGRRQGGNSLWREGKLQRNTTLLEGAPFTSEEGLQRGTGWSPGQGKPQRAPKGGEAPAASCTPLAKAGLGSWEKPVIQKSELHPLTRRAARLSAARVSSSCCPG